MADNRLVVAIFPDEAAADSAGETLKSFDKATNELRLTSIGVLVLDENGQLKTHKMGSRSTAKGAGIGLLLAVVAPPTLLAGVVGGAVLGSFHHKGLALSDGERAALGKELTGGKAALGVLASDSDADRIAERLTQLGGQAEDYEVSDEALAAVAQAAPAETARTGTSTTS